MFPSFTRGLKQRQAVQWDDRALPLSLPRRNSSGTYATRENGSRVSCFSRFLVACALLLLAVSGPGSSRLNRL